MAKLWIFSAPQKLPFELKTREKNRFVSQAKSTFCTFRRQAYLYSDYTLCISIENAPMITMICCVSERENVRVWRVEHAHKHT